MPHTAEGSRTQQVQQQFTAFLRDPDHAPPLPAIERRRLDLYAELIYNNVEGLLSANFPVIRGLHDDDAWAALVRAFLVEHRAHTPLFMEFGREFLKYVEQRQIDARGDPPFLLELAHYEWAEHALAVDEHDIAAVAHDPAGDPIDGVPVVSPLAWSLGYRFPVHRIDPDYRPDTPPEQPTLLLLVRERDDRVSFHEINPLTAMLFQRLQENERATGLECLEALLAEAAPGQEDALRDGGIATLRELKSLQAILGTL